jgi:hypothetical protein
MDGWIDEWEWMDRYRDRVRAAPDDTITRLLLARDLADISRQANLDQTRQNVAELRGLVRDYPYVAEVTSCFAWSLRFLLGKAGDDQAKAVVEEARALHRAHPDNADVVHTLAEALARWHLVAAPGDEPGIVDELRDLMGMYPGNSMAGYRVAWALAAVLRRRDLAIPDDDTLDALRQVQRYTAYPDDVDVTEILVDALRDHSLRASAADRAVLIDEMRAFARAYTTSHRIAEDLATATRLPPNRRGD